jgi:hypothetical protein
MYELVEPFSSGRSMLQHPCVHDFMSLNLYVFTNTFKTYHKEVQDDTHLLVGKKVFKKAQYAWNVHQMWILCGFIRIVLQLGVKINWDECC